MAKIHKTKANFESARKNAVNSDIQLFVKDMQQKRKKKQKLQLHSHRLSTGTGLKELRKLSKAYTLLSAVDEAKLSKMTDNEINTEVCDEKATLNESIGHEESTCTITEMSKEEMEEYNKERKKYEKALEDAHEREKNKSALFALIGYWF
jgi:Cys-tRNA synthase (O-phospho-L-seryl-tRNA:Cys-tRNA synthase)